MIKVKMVLSGTIMLTPLLATMSVYSGQEIDVTVETADVLLAKGFACLVLPP
jgi:hypothetical protein